MRRIIIWLASTITIVVLLFGYHTSTNKTSSAATVPSTSGPTTTSSPSASSGTGSSNLTWADIDATAAYGSGPDAAQWLQTRPIDSALIIWADGAATRIPKTSPPQ